MIDHVSSAKAQRLRTLGASATIDYTTEPQWGDRVLELTDGRGVDRVVEIGGGAAIAESIKAVAIGGEIALVGMLAPSETGLSIIWTSSSVKRHCARSGQSRDDLEAFGRATEAWDLHPVIDRVHDFDEARTAVASYGQPGQFGKLVIRH